jgi:nucleoside-diphosphate-sugar epimerase
VKKALVTGISSFTGAALAQALADEGWAVAGVLSQKRAAYTGLREERLASLEGVVFHQGVNAASDAFFDLIRDEKPDALVFHHHHMEAFRSPDYDVKAAHALTIAPLESLCAALRDAGTKGVIHTGTVYESGEGGRGDGEAVSPYAQSKTDTWQALKEDGDGLLLARVIVPNPIGPLENDDRLGPILLALAKGERTEPLTIRSPDDVVDFIPAADLGRVYAHAANEIVEGKASIHRPSGCVITVRQYVERFSDWVIDEVLGLPKPTVGFAAPAPEPRIARNPESESLKIDWRAFCGGYGEGSGI